MLRVTNTANRHSHTRYFAAKPGQRLETREPHSRVDLERGQRRAGMARIGRMKPQVKDDALFDRARGVSRASRVRKLEPA